MPRPKKSAPKPAQEKITVPYVRITPDYQIAFVVEQMIIDEGFTVVNQRGFPIAGLVNTDYIFITSQKPDEEKGYGGFGFIPQPTNTKPCKRPRALDIEARVIFRQADTDLDYTAGMVEQYEDTYQIIIEVAETELMDKYVDLSIKLAELLNDQKTTEVPIIIFAIIPLAQKINGEFTNLLQITNSSGAMGYMLPQQEIYYDEEDF